MKNLFLFANGSVSAVHEQPAAYRMEVGLLSRAVKQMGAEAASNRRAEPGGPAKALSPGRRAVQRPQPARGDSQAPARESGRSWWWWAREPERPRMSLADVRVVRNDLRHADLDFSGPVGRMAVVRAWVAARVAALRERIGR